MGDLEGHKSSRSQKMHTCKIHRGLSLNIFCYPSMWWIALERKSRSAVSNSLQLHGLDSPWNSLGQNTRLGNIFLLQGILPIQGSNPGLPRCRWILYQLSHKGSPRILE